MLNIVPSAEKKFNHKTIKKMNVIKKIFAAFLLLLAIILIAGGFTSIFGIPLGWLGVRLMREAGIDD